MITDVKHTLLNATSWPSFNYALFSLALSGPLNDDYNQWNQIYQCHGDPNGKVYVNVPWPAICLDVDNELVYAKFPLELHDVPPGPIGPPSSAQVRLSNTGWQQPVL